MRAVLCFACFVVLNLSWCHAQAPSKTSGLFAQRAKLKATQTQLLARQQAALKESERLASRLTELKRAESVLLAAEKAQAPNRKWRCYAYGTEHDSPTECSDPSKGGEWLGGNVDPALSVRRNELTAAAAAYEADYAKYEAGLDQLTSEADALKAQLASASPLLRDLARIDDFVARNADIADCNKAVIASTNEIGYNGFDGLVADQIYAKVTADKDPSIVRLGSESSPNTNKVGEDKTPLEMGFDMAGQPDKYRVYLAIDSASLTKNKPKDSTRTYDHGHVMELIPGGSSWRDGEVIQAQQGKSKLHVAPLGGSATSATATWHRPHYEVFAVPVKPRTIR